MSSEFSPRPFFKKKRYWFLLVILASLAAAAAVVMNGKRELERQLTELRETGFPTTGEELNDFYSIPLGVVDSTEPWIEAIDRIPKLTQVELERLPFIGNSDVPLVGASWPELDTAKDFLADHSEAMEAIRTAANAGGAARFPVDFRMGLNTLLSDTQETRQLARLLILDAYVSQRVGNDQQALQDIVDTFALADSLQYEPVMISQLVRIAIYSIASDAAKKLIIGCDWNDEHLAALQSAASKMNGREALKLAMKGELAMGLSAIEQMPGLIGFSDASKKEIIRLILETTASLDKPWHESLEEQQAILNDFQSKTGMINGIRLRAAQMLFPATQKASEAGARCTAQQRCIIAALAAERYKLANNVYPNSLSDIPANLLPTGFTTISLSDTFTGTPLVYIKSDTGIMVYSVGPDGVDDGGKIANSEDTRATDIGFATHHQSE